MGEISCKTPRVCEKLPSWRKLPFIVKYSFMFCLCVNVNKRTDDGVQTIEDTTGPLKKLDEAQRSQVSQRKAAAKAGPLS